MQPKCPEQSFDYFSLGSQVSSNSLIRASGQHEPDMYDTSVAILSAKMECGCSSTSIAHVMPGLDVIRGARHEI